MKRYLSKFIALTLVTGALCTSTSALAGNAYGFGSLNGGCSLWSMLYPISVQQPDDEPVSYYVNFIWIEEDSYKGMEEYADFFTTPYGQNAWPSGVNILRDDGKANCTGDDECTGADISEVNIGISAYNNLKAEFPDKKVNVAKVRPNGAGALTWVYLPLRKVDLLRIEVFTPMGLIGTSNTYVEPIYFEYRATGNGSELKLKEWGSTSENNTSYIILPDTFNPVLTSDIQVWFTRTSSKPTAGITPKAHIDALTSAQIDRVPSGCK